KPPETGLHISIIDIFGMWERKSVVSLGLIIGLVTYSEPNPKCTRPWPCFREKCDIELRSRLAWLDFPVNTIFLSMGRLQFFNQSSNITCPKCTYGMSTRRLGKMMPAAKPARLIG